MCGDLTEINREGEWGGGGGGGWGLAGLDWARSVFLHTKDKMTRERETASTHNSVPANCFNPPGFVFSYGER